MKLEAKRWKFSGPCQFSMHAHLIRTFNITIQTYYAIYCLNDAQCLPAGSAQDEMNRFCGDLPRGVNLTREELEERSIQYSAAHFNCPNVTTTCPADCLSVLNNVSQLNIVVHI